MADWSTWHFQMPQQNQSGNLLSDLLQIQQLKEDREERKGYRKLRDLQVREAEGRLSDLARQRDEQAQVRNAFKQSVVQQQAPIGGQQTASLYQAAGMQAPAALGPLKLDRGMLIGKLNQTSPEIALQQQQEFQKNDVDAAKAQAQLQEAMSKASKEQLAMVKERVGLAGSLLQSLKALPPELKPQVYAVKRQYAIQNGLASEQDLPPQYPGDQWLDSKISEAMTVDQAADNALQQQQATESQRHNKQTEGLTARGQNMTDSRQREQNDIARQMKNAQLQQLQMENAQTMEAKQGAIDSINQAIASTDRLGKHPGLSAAVGMGLQKAMTGNVATIPGTNKADFEAELSSYKSRLFLPMVAKLKGMGALSDAEGKKLTDAVGALDYNMSEAAFRDSLVRIKGDLNTALQRTQGSAAKQGGGIKILRDAQGNIIGVE